MIKFN